MINPIFQTQIPYVSLKSGLVSKANLLKIFNCYKIEGEGHISYSGKNQVLKVAGGDIILYYSSYQFKEVSFNDEKFKTIKVNKNATFKLKYPQYITLTLKDGDVIDYSYDNYDFFYMTLEQYNKFIEATKPSAKERTVYGAAAQARAITLAEDNPPEADKPQVGGEGSNTYLFNGFDELSRVYGFNQFEVHTTDFHDDSNIIKGDTVSGGGDIVEGNAMYAVPDYGYKGKSLSGYGYYGAAQKTADFYNYDRKIQPFDATNTYLWNWLTNDATQRMVILTSFDETTDVAEDEFYLWYIPETHMLKLKYHNRESDYFDVTYQDVWVYIREPATSYSKLGNLNTYVTYLHYMCNWLYITQNDLQDIWNQLYVINTHNKKTYIKFSSRLGDEFGRIDVPSETEIAYSSLSDIRYNISINVPTTQSYKLKKSSITTELSGIKISSKTSDWKQYFERVYGDPSVASTSSTSIIPITISQNYDTDLLGDGSASNPYELPVKYDTDLTSRNLDSISGLMINDGNGSIVAKINQDYIENGTLAGLAVGHSPLLSTNPNQIKPTLYFNYGSYYYDSKQATVEKAKGFMYEVLTEINSPAGFLDISEYFKNGINFYNNNLKTIFDRLYTHGEDSKLYHEHFKKTGSISYQSKYEWTWFIPGLGGTHYNFTVPPYNFVEIANMGGTDSGIRTELFSNDWAITTVTFESIANNGLFYPMNVFNGSDYSDLSSWFDQPAISNIFYSLIPYCSRVGGFNHVYQYNDQWTIPKTPSAYAVVLEMGRLSIIDPEVEINEATVEVHETVSAPYFVLEKDADTIYAVQALGASDLDLIFWRYKVELNDGSDKGWTEWICNTNSALKRFVFDKAYGYDEEVDEFVRVSADNSRITIQAKAWRNGIMSDIEQTVVRLAKANVVEIGERLQVYYFPLNNPFYKYKFIINQNLKTPLSNSKHLVLKDRATPWGQNIPYIGIQPGSNQIYGCTFANDNQFNQMGLYDMDSKDYPYLGEVEADFIEVSVENSTLKYNKYTKQITGTFSVKYLMNSWTADKVYDGPEGSSEGMFTGWKLSLADKRIVPNETKFYSYIGEGKDFAGRPWIGGYNTWTDEKVFDMEKDFRLETEPFDFDQDNFNIYLYETQSGVSIADEVTDIPVEGHSIQLMADTPSKEDEGYNVTALNVETEKYNLIIQNDIDSTERFDYWQVDVVETVDGGASYQVDESPQTLTVYAPAKITTIHSTYDSGKKIDLSITKWYLELEYKYEGIGGLTYIQRATLNTPIEVREHGATDEYKYDVNWDVSDLFYDPNDDNATKNNKIRYMSGGTLSIKLTVDPGVLPVITGSSDYVKIYRSKYKINENNGKSYLGTFDQGYSYSFDVTKQDVYISFGRIYPDKPMILPLDYKIGTVSAKTKYNLPRIYLLSLESDGDPDNVDEISPAHMITRFDAHTFSEDSRLTGKLYFVTPDPTNPSTGVKIGEIDYKTSYMGSISPLVAPYYYTGRSSFMNKVSAKVFFDKSQWKTSGWTWPHNLGISNDTWLARDSQLTTYDKYDADTIFVQLNNYSNEISNYFKPEDYRDPDADYIMVWTSDYSSSGSHRFIDWVIWDVDTKTPLYETNLDGVVIKQDEAASTLLYNPQEGILSGDLKIKYLDNMNIWKKNKTGMMTINNAGTGVASDNNSDGYGALFQLVSSTSHEGPTIYVQEYNWNEPVSLKDQSFKANSYIDKSTKSIQGSIWEWSYAFQRELVKVCDVNIPVETVQVTMGVPELPSGARVESIVVGPPDVELTDSRCYRYTTFPQTVTFYEDVDIKQVTVLFRGDHTLDTFTGKVDTNLFNLTVSEIRPVGGADPDEDDTEVYFTHSGSGRYFTIGKDKHYTATVIIEQEAYQKANFTISGFNDNPYITLYEAQEAIPNTDGLMKVAYVAAGQYITPDKTDEATQYYISYDRDPEYYKSTPYSIGTLTKNKRISIPAGKIYTHGYSKVGKLGSYLESSPLYVLRRHPTTNQWFVEAEILSNSLTPTMSALHVASFQNTSSDYRQFILFNDTVTFNGAWDSLDATVGDEDFFIGSIYLNKVHLSSLSGIWRGMSAVKTSNSAVVQRVYDRETGALVYSTNAIKYTSSEAYITTTYSMADGTYGPVGSIQCPYFMTTWSAINGWSPWTNDSSNIQLLFTAGNKVATFTEVRWGDSIPVSRLNSGQYGEVTNAFDPGDIIWPSDGSTPHTPLVYISMRYTNLDGAGSRGIGSAYLDLKQLGTVSLTPTFPSGYKEDFYCQNAQWVDSDGHTYTVGSLEDGQTRSVPIYTPARLNSISISHDNTSLGSGVWENVKATITQSPVEELQQSTTVTPTAGTSGGGIYYATIKAPSNWNYMTQGGTCNLTLTISSIKVTFKHMFFSKDEVTSSDLDGSPTTTQTTDLSYVYGTKINLYDLRKSLSGYTFSGVVGLYDSDGRFLTKLIDPNAPSTDSNWLVTVNRKDLEIRMLYKKWYSNDFTVIVDETNETPYQFANCVINYELSGVGTPGTADYSVLGSSKVFKDSSSEKYLIGIQFEAFAYAKNIEVSMYVGSTLKYTCTLTDSDLSITAVNNTKQRIKAVHNAYHPKSGEIVYYKITIPSTYEVKANYWLYSGPGGSIEGSSSKTFSKAYKSTDTASNYLNSSSNSSISGSGLDAIYSYNGSKYLFDYVYVDRGNMSAELPYNSTVGVYGPVTFQMYFYKQVVTHIVTIKYKSLTDATIGTTRTIAVNEGESFSISSYRSTSYLYSSYRDYEYSYTTIDGDRYTSSTIIVNSDLEIIIYWDAPDTSVINFEYVDQNGDRIGRRDSEVVVSNRSMSLITYREPTSWDGVYHDTNCTYQYTEVDGVRWSSSTFAPTQNSHTITYVYNYSQSVDENYSWNDVSVTFSNVTSYGFTCRIKSPSDWNYDYNYTYQVAVSDSYTTTQGGSVSHDWAPGMAPGSHIDGTGSIPTSNAAFEFSWRGSEGNSPSISYQVILSHEKIAKSKTFSTHA